MSILGVIGRILLVLLKIVLVLLLLLLLLVLLILVLPIDYEAAGKADGESGPSGIEARAKLKLFLGLVRFQGSLREGEVRYSLKAAAFTLKKGARRIFGKEPEGGETASAMDRAEPKAAESPEEEAAHEKSPGPSAEALSGEKQRQQVTEPQPQEKIPKESAPRENRKREDRERRERPPGPSLAERADDLRDKAEEGFYRAADALNGASDAVYGAMEKTAGLREKALGAWDWLQEPVNTRTLRRVKKAVGRILRHILPKVFKAKGVFGIGNPATTGQLLGAFYSLYPLYGDRWELELAGEFLEKKIQGRLYMKGRIRLIVIVASVLGLLADRNIRRWIWKRIRRKKSQ